jgi:ribosomal protein S15P/S13E
MEASILNVALKAFQEINERLIALEKQVAILETRITEMESHGKSISQ